MSENLKRAESLFNRIMKQNSDKPEKHERVDRKKHHSHHTQVVAAPSRDPARLAREAVQQIPPEHHVIPYCWTIWHHSRQRQRGKDSEEETREEPNTGITVDTYLQTIKEVDFATLDGSSTKVIGSLEQLWMTMSSIKHGFDLPVRSEFLVFKTGINPVWEDPVNIKGGRWVFRFNRRSLQNPGDLDLDDNGVSSLRRRTTLIWERLVLRTLSGSLIPDSAEPYQDLLLNDISGLVLSVRREDDVISIWNSNLNFHHKSKKLTSFQARRIICDSILRVVRECDLILSGSDCVDTVDSGSNERVHGVSFDYRLHADNNSDKYQYRRHNR